ncbi:MAG: hypothetical protein JXO51_04810 [Candidatus Aminicenantes bacterium]|nr:hypothetical protein [Candidatus Aminicenantes bacterium]
MNVQLAPAALEEIAVLRACGYRGAGFLLGSAVGRFLLVERLLALDFDGGNGDRVYGAVAGACRERLQGVFFCRKPPFVLDWFIGDLVLLIRPKQILPFTCEFYATGRKARLRPLPEEEESAWTP